MGTCQSVNNSDFKRPNSSSPSSPHAATPNNSFIKTRFTKLRRSLRKSLRDKTEDTEYYDYDEYHKRDSECDDYDDENRANESTGSISSPVINSQRDTVQLTSSSLPVVKVKLVEFLEFQEFNTFVETVQIKPNQNETYILKNSNSIDEPVYNQRPANKSARTSRMSKILNEINTNLPEQKMNVNNNKAAGAASPSSFSTGIPVTNRFGFKHIAAAKPTSISLPKTSTVDKRPEKSLPIENEIEVSTSSPNTTSTASPASSISSNSSYNRYSMTKQSILKKPAVSHAINRPISNASNPSKMNTASSSLSSLSSVSNSSSNLSSNNQIAAKQPIQRSIKSSSATLKMNMENITRLPVRKDTINSQSSDSFQRPTSSTHHNQPRKHSFTPYNLTSHNDQTEKTSHKLVDTFEKKEVKDTSPSKSKLIRFSSPKVSRLTNVTSSTSNNQPLIARRTDSAYCSSTSSTSSSTANDNDKKTQSSDLNNNHLDESKPLEQKVPTYSTPEIDLLLNEKAPFEIEEGDENSEDHAISYDKNPDTSSGSKASIRDSICELNQLMLISSSSIGSTHQHNTQTNIVEQKQLANEQQAAATSSCNNLHFKLPSNLPAPSVEDGGEVIQIDVETYRLLVQDLQDCKLILHKLASLMRDQPGGILNEEEFALELNKLKLTSEQSTQTE